MATDESTAELVTLDPNDARTRAEIEELLERAERASGHPPLAEASLLTWRGKDGEFTGLVHRVAGSIGGYAHLGARAQSWNVEIVLHPDAGAPDDVRRRLLESAVIVARRAGALEIRYWDIQHGAEREATSALGFAVERDLLQMRVPLPLQIERPPLDAAITLRPFRVGEDEERWLVVNNRAFAAHPEQGHWDLTALVAREAAAWFDPEGFILGEEAGELAASCWTKVHTERSLGLGEIYVISVNPDFQGRGLGRLLTVAGLDWLSERVSIGMLYVDASNVAAVGLYRSLGFTVDHVDRCYLWRDEPSDGR